MSDVNYLKDKINSKTVNFVLLTIATAGIYPIIWLTKNAPIIDQATKTPTANHIYIIWMAVCAGLGGALGATGDEVFDVISFILSIALIVLYIVWAFRAKKALSEYALKEFNIHLSMNKFYVFIFNVYYINYCINDLPEASRKQNPVSEPKLES